MRFRTAIVAVLLVGYGCNDPCRDLSDTEPSIEIGTGWEAFIPIGDITGFEKGPQGGFHIYASLRATGLFGGDANDLVNTMPSLTYSVESEDGTLTGGFVGMRRPMEYLDDGRAERLGDLAILSSYEPSEMEGVEVDIFAEMEDTCGRNAMSTTNTILSEGAF